MRQQNTRVLAPKKQQGIVLVVALIMLLLITILGVSAVNRSSINTQVAGNSMYSMLVYQGAESTIAKSVTNKDLSNIASSIASRPAAFTVPAAYFPKEEITGGGTLIATSNVSHRGLFDCPITSGMATSTLFKCHIFDVDARSKLKATSARDRHIEGKSIVSPSP